MILVPLLQCYAPVNFNEDFKLMHFSKKLGCQSSAVQKFKLSVAIPLRTFDQFWIALYQTLLKYGNSENINNTQ